MGKLCLILAASSSDSDDGYSWSGVYFFRVPDSRPTSGDQMAFPLQATAEFGIVPAMPENFIVRPLHRCTISRPFSYCAEWDVTPLQGKTGWSGAAQGRLLTFGVTAISTSG